MFGGRIRVPSSPRASVSGEEEASPHTHHAEGTDIHPLTGAPSVCTEEEPSEATTEEELSSSCGPLGLPEGLLRSCALRWPTRTGARSIEAAAGGPGAYSALLLGPVSVEDEEQIKMDVERSTVDDLETLYVGSLDEATLRDALSRLLSAWCCRQPGGYCQGMNFVAMVLLVVMRHGLDAWSEQAVRRAEESAFWTFVALMERILPADFYAAPSMPGLQRDVRVLFHLFQVGK